MTTNFLTEKRQLYATNHNLLRFGWPDMQLEKVAVEFELREMHNWKVLAAILCSVVAEHLDTGDPVRYSRRKEWYAERADRIGNPLMAYRQVVPAMDLLLKLGLIKGIIGVWVTDSKGNRIGKQSTAWPTPEVIDRITPILDLDDREQADEDGVLVLRDKNKRSLPFPDTPETRRMAKELETLNTAYQAHTWSLRGKKLDIGKARRVFNQDVLRGGRVYHLGSSYQQLSHDERAQITIEIDGVAHPMIEHDLVTLHVQLAYAWVGVKMPTYAKGDDAYTIPGFHRNREVKPALNTMFSAATDRQALGVIGGKLLGKDWNRGRELIAAIKAKHPDLIPMFCSDAGAKFQRTDSDMAMAIALAVLRHTGRPPLIIHDSFVVAACDEQILLEEMKHALQEALCTLSTKASTTPNTLLDRLQSTIHSLPSLPLGNHFSDQGGCVPPKAYEARAYAHSRPAYPDPGLDRLPKVPYEPIGGHR